MSIDLSKINGALKGMQKKYGDQSVVSEEDLAMKRTFLDSPQLNSLFGGSFARARIFEFYGGENDGKTTTALLILADLQRKGEFVVVVDLEGSFDYDYAKFLGLDVSPDKLMVLPPSSGEEAFDKVEMLVRTGQIGGILFDSLSAVSADAEMEEEISKNSIGLSARLIGQFLRKILPHMYHSETPTNIILISQIRMKIGVLFGNPETTSGGNAPRFYSSVRVRFNKKEQQFDSKNELLSTTLKMKCTKNKTGVNGRKAELFIDPIVGYDPTPEYVNLGVDLGIIEKAGSWYSYNGEKIGQGSIKVSNFLKDNPKVFDDIKVRLEQAMKTLKEGVIEDDDLENSEVNTTTTQSQYGE